jgi:hypothetical protein
MAGVFLALMITSGFFALGGYLWSIGTDLRARKNAAVAAEEGQTQSSAGASGHHAALGSDAAPPDDEIHEVRLGFSFSAVGSRLRTEGWRGALPWLLAATGLLALLVFGALALFASLPSRLFGVAALAVAVYVAYTELRSFWRALRGQDE